jgi:hypothetical protein
MTQVTVTKSHVPGGGLETKASSRVVRGGGGEAMRRTLQVVALLAILGLLMFASSISALRIALKAPNDTGDDLDSVVANDGDDIRKCPNCGCLMKLCIETSEYRFVCHCGCFVLR